MNTCNQALLHSRRGVSVYSVLPLQRSSFGQAADARVSGLTLHPSAASVPMPAVRPDGSVRQHQVSSICLRMSLRPMRHLRYGLSASFVGSMHARNCITT